MFITLQEDLNIPAIFNKHLFHYCSESNTAVSIGLAVLLQVDQQLAHRHAPWLSDNRP